MKNTLLLLSLSSTAFAANSGSTPLEQAQWGSPYTNFPERIAILKDRPSVSAHVDMLWWDASQDGMTFSMRDSDPGVMINNAKMHSMSSDIHPGLRIGLHALFPRWDKFDMRLAWTYHEIGHIKTVRQTPERELFFICYPVLAGAFAPINPPALPSAARSKWAVETQLVDWEIGRTFRPFDLPNRTYKLGLRPFLGMRYLHIDQAWNLIFTQTDMQNVKEDLIVKNISEFRGYGLRFGIDSDWVIRNEWSLYANIAWSVLMGEILVNTSEQFPQQTSSGTARLESEWVTGKEIVDLDFGILWKRLYNNDKYGLTYKFGWEMHHFFGQSQWVDIVPGSAACALQNHGDLKLSGFKLSVKLDF